MTGGVRGYRARSGRSYREIERCASRFRELLSIPPTERLPVDVLFENLHLVRLSIGDGRVVPLDYDVSESAGREASTAYDPEFDRILVRLKPSVYDGLLRDDPRARFNVCHECGHAIMHPLEAMNLSSLDNGAAALQRGKATGHRHFEDTEWQADAFAGALLMPARGLAALGDGLATWRVMEAFGVSESCARIRLRVFESRRSELVTA